MTTRRVKFAIVGIQYSMDGSTKEERKKQAEQLVDEMPEEEPVLLKREPDNLMDSHAIAVYHETRKIGYVSKDFTDEVEQAFSQKKNVVQARILYGEHIALFADVEVNGELKPRRSSEERRWEAPFLCSIPFIEEERSLEFVSEILLTNSYGDTAADLIMWTEKFLSLSRQSICAKDSLDAHLVMDIVWDFYLNGERNAEEEVKLSELHYELKELCGDYTCLTGPGEIFEAHMERMKAAFSAERTGFFSKYDDLHLFVPLSEADKGAVEKEVERLTNWLHAVPNGIFLPKKWDIKQVGTALRYLSLTRTELYDVMGAMLVVDRLTAPSPEPMEQEVDEAEDEELFHFIHHRISSKAQKRKIDASVRIIVTQTKKVRDICTRLFAMQAGEEILLPDSNTLAFDELHRMGMPDEKTDGFSFKNFAKYYKEAKDAHHIY